MTQKMDHCNTPCHTPRCFPLLELLTSLPELVHMWCPPERGVMLVNTSKFFWGKLVADLRVPTLSDASARNWSVGCEQID